MADARRWLKRIGRRSILTTAVALTLALWPALARAQAPGSLTQFTSPDNCIEAPSSASTECQTKAPGLSRADDVAVSPDGKNVYVLGFNDAAIAEFARNADGSLTWIGCIADSSASGGSCSNLSATGLTDPRAITVSPDGQNVYVAAGLDPNGDIAEFTRSADGSLAPVANSSCIGENGSTGCAVGGHGLQFPNDLVVSPDDQDVYVADQVGEAVTELVRAPNGSLSEPGGSADCIQDPGASSSDCSVQATGLSGVTGVAISPDGNDVYTAGAPDLGSSGSIAEFARNTSGTLTALGCVGTPAYMDPACGQTATGLVGLIGLVVSPDGNNVYAASQSEGGPIAEFSRRADGTLAQLNSPNDCIAEGGGFGCGTTGVGIADGYELVVSPDGTNLYAVAESGSFCYSGTCSDVAEFSRDAANGGALTQLPSPDACVQDSGANGSECPGNENGSGLGGPGLAISPDGNNLYVTGTDGIAEFKRGTHTLTVSLAGSGSGGVSDDTGAITCPSTCSSAYTTDTLVTLTATPGANSIFTGWSGACSGTGKCQVTMSADSQVTATFGPPPGSPTPVITGAPSAVTDAGAGFSGSVNPEGLPTTVYFQYGLDRRYSQVGASGPTYTQQTAAQPLTADFTTHAIGPVPVSGLIPNAVYHVRLVATNSAGTAFGQDVTFTTKLAPAPGTPTIGQTFNLAPVSGLVLVLIHGHLVPVTQVETIPSGTVIDSRHGTFELVISLGGGGPARDAAAHGKPKTQTGQFGGAVVRIHQIKSGHDKGLTTVMMVESAFKGAPAQSVCHAPSSARDAQTARFNLRVIQLLHAKAHGRFATSGRYSAATVRGTVWEMIARCDGTLVKDIKDEVVVTDFVRHKTIVLHAGQSYLAPGRHKK